MEESSTTAEREPAGPKRADELSIDAQLLARIARERDAGAMSRFFERHHGPAYNLALHMTGSREQAEDVLQEALLVVWQRAGHYRGSGPARGWLLRIVAFKALQFRRGERRADRRIRAVGSIRSAEDRDRGGRELPGLGEFGGPLQAALATLSDLDRSLLLLRFTADLRVTEIARQCGIPRQTVKFRLKRTLRLLRSALERSGIVPSGVPLSAHWLGEALVGLAQPPENLCRRLIGHLSDLPGTRDHGAGWGWPAWTAAAAGILCAAVGIYLPRGEVPRATGRPEARPLEAEATAVSGPSRVVPFAHCFSFATPQHVRFPVTQGVWNWQPAAGGGSGALVVDPAHPLLCFLPLKVPRRPLYLKIRLRSPQEWRSPEISTAHFACGAFRSEQNTTPPYRQYKKLQNRRELFRADYSYQAYLFERFTVGLFDSGHIHYIHAYEESYPGDRILLEFQNWIVEEVLIRDLLADEVPAQLRDLPALIRVSKDHTTLVPRLPCGRLLPETGRTVHCMPPFPEESGAQDPGGS